LINLPPYRPELKSIIEKFFDLIQNSYKDILKGKGVIMPDFQERGAHDYRNDAVLTMQEFERIVLKCIIHYNCNRAIQNYPYHQEMLDCKVPPHANAIWNWKIANQEANLIDISKKDVILTLLPRTAGKFTRYGLKSNGLRYYADGYKEKFLNSENVTVSYNPDDCGKIWFKEKDGSFVEFTLIEKRFSNMTFDDVQNIKEKQKQITKNAVQEQYQAKIDLMSFIETIAETSYSKKGGSYNG
jgi:hypothetical protein